MIGWFKNQELARKLILINFILIVLPLSIMGYFAFTRFAATLEQKVGDYQLQTLKQLTLNIDTYMAELDRLTLMPYQYEQIIAFLESKRMIGQALTLEEIKQLNSFVSQVFLNGRIDIVGVSLFGESGASYVVLPESQYVTNYRLDENAEWLKTSRSAMDNPHLLRPIIFNRRAARFILFSRLRGAAQLRYGEKARLYCH